MVSIFKGRPWAESDAIRTQLQETGVTFFRIVNAQGGKRKIVELMRQQAGDNKSRLRILSRTAVAAMLVAVLLVSLWFVLPEQACERVLVCHSPQSIRAIRVQEVTVERALARQLESAVELCVEDVFFRTHDSISIELADGSVVSGRMGGMVLQDAEDVRFDIRGHVHVNANTRTLRVKYLVSERMNRFRRCVEYIKSRWYRFF